MTLRGIWFQGIQGCIISTVLFVGSVEAHSGHDCPDCVTSTELANHSALFLTLLLDALGDELNANQTASPANVNSEAIGNYSFVHGSGKLVPAVFSTAVNKAMMRYRDLDSAGEVPESFTFEEVHRRWYKKALHKLSTFLGESSGKAAKYGILFGASYFTFEVIEHSALLLTAGMPTVPGLGPLCAMFPVLWALTIGPLMIPSEYWRAYPEKQSLGTRLVNTVRLPLRRWKMKKLFSMAQNPQSLQIQAKHQGAILGEPLHAFIHLQESPLWLQGVAFNSNANSGAEVGESSDFAPSMIVAPILNKLKSNMPPSVEDILMLEGLLTVPTQMLLALSRTLFDAGVIGFMDFATMQIRSQRLEKTSERLVKVLIQLTNHETLENGLRHAQHIQKWAENYLQLVKMFAPVKAETTYIVGRPLSDTQGPYSKSAMKEAFSRLNQALRSLERAGKKSCTESVAALSG